MRFQFAIFLGLCSLCTPQLLYNEFVLTVTYFVVHQLNHKTGEAQHLLVDKSLEEVQSLKETQLQQIQNAADDVTNEASSEAGEVEEQAEPNDVLKISKILAQQSPLQNSSKSILSVALDQVGSNTNITQLFSDLKSVDVPALLDTLGSWAKSMTIHQLFQQIVSVMAPGVPINIEDVLKEAGDVGDGLDSGYLLKQAAALNISKQCEESLMYLARGLYQNETYAWKYIDALGKPGAGISHGNVQWLGAYDQCRDIEKTYSKNETKLGHSVHVDGKYCQATLSMGKITPQLGICVPSTCDSDDLNVMVRAVKQLIPPKYSQNVNPTIYCKEKPEFKTSSYIFIVFFAIGLLLLLIGSFYDVISDRVLHPFKGLPSIPDQHDDDCQLLDSQQAEQDNHDVEISYQPGNNRSKLRELLLAFSGFVNGSKIMSTSSRGGDSFLSALNGIRVLSMWWVVFGHSISFQAMFMSNMVIVPDLIKRFTFQVWMQATLSVDSFFFLSGLLVCYLSLKQLDSPKSLNWIMFYFHRFWRLTPLYMFVLLFFMGMLGFVSDGPYSAFFDAFPGLDSCYQYWWTNLLYVNNFVPGGMDKQCMAWAWYLANDMQFFIVSPLIIYPLYRWRNVGLGVMLAMLTASLTATGIVARQHHLSPVSITLNLTKEDQDYSEYIYIQPQYRISPYIIGMFTGYIFYKTRGTFKLPRFLPAIGWCVSTVLGMLLIYGFYGNYKHSKPLSPGVGAWYVSCGRCAWGVVLSWICFACGHGYGGAINKFLSWSIWSPLSRLTYAVYLVHPIVMMLYYIQLRLPTYYTDINVAYVCIGNLVVSYGVSFVVSVIIESPMMALEKVIFKKWR